MAGIGYFLLFSVGGIAIVYFLLPKIRPVAKAYLGLCLGVLLMMWLPALFAFVLDFTVRAHLAALGLLCVLVLAAGLLRDKTTQMRFSAPDKRLLILLAAVALPLTLLGGYLQYTHVLRPAADGTLHVGQSTYGDLPLHLSIATSLRGASFPPDYSILPGERLSYPFLADSLSTSFLLMGGSLQLAMVFPGTWMMMLTFSGYLILTERMAKTWKGAVLAVLFFFINGGLGFVYLFDMQGVVLGEMGNNELQSVAGLWNRIQAVIGPYSWYQTPANHAEFLTYNLRWSNVIVDMMVPQRTTLAGWCQVIPCVYLLYDSLMPAEAENAPLLQRKALPYRQMILLGLWGGLLPMVNTHCFLALGLLSLGWMGYDLLHRKEDWMRTLLQWGIFGFLAVAVAVPQLFTWTFHQAVGNAGFLKFQFNWVNGEMGMPDGYLWFYIKNIGLPFLLILLALLEKTPQRRFLASGAFVIFAAAEFIRFQPNVYDNNKLFYIWYMVCCVIAADYGLELLGRFKGLRAKNVLAVLCAFLCFCTGAISIAHEVNSDWQMFSAQEAEAAQFIEENTAQDATFMTGTQHINFVSSLAGRRIVCGPDTWLYYHGFDTEARKTDIASFYADPSLNGAVLDKYGVDYIVISDGHERSSLLVDDYAFEKLYEKVYESREGSIEIYRVGKEQRE